MSDPLRSLRPACGALLALLVAGPLDAATPEIAGGADFAVVLTADGKVWRTGRGLGSPVATPALVVEDPSVVGIDASVAFGFLRHADGGVSVFNVGYGLTAGIPGVTALLAPQRIPGLARVRQLAAQFDHVLALDGDGAVWAWGLNAFGQLGDGSTTDRAAPVRVQGLPASVIAVAAGHSNSYALTANGEVWGWGAACCGALGAAVTYDPGEVRAQTTPVRIPGLTGIVEIDAGTALAFARRADGTVLSFGFDGPGMLGQGPEQTGNALEPLPVLLPAPAVAITAGFNMALALDAQGGVWAWGGNGGGQLGQGDRRARATPTRVPGLPTIRAIGSGAFSVYAIAADGRVFVWGSNDQGQLGDGDALARRSPVTMRTPVDPVAAFNVDASMPGADNVPPIALPSLAFTGDGIAPASMVARGADSLDADGRIVGYRWISASGITADGPEVRFTVPNPGTFGAALLVTDDRGAVGLDLVRAYVAPSTSTVSTTPRVTAADVEHAVAVTADGRVLTWGFAAYLGEYGDRFTDVDQSLATEPGIGGALTVAAAENAVFVVLADGGVLAFGENGFGQLGLGTAEAYVREPTTITGLPPVAAVSDGFGHVLALTRDGRVFAWGVNTFGELGLGDRDGRDVPVAVPGLANIVAVAAGRHLSYALAADGRVFAWGRDADGGLGLGQGAATVTAPVAVPGLAGITRIDALEDGLAAFGAGDAVFGTGPTLATLATAADPRRAFAVPALADYRRVAGRLGAGVAVHADGGVATFGAPGPGTLGYVTTATTPQPLRRLPGVSEVVDVSAGGLAVFARRANGTVLSWGRNRSGQLGHGTFAISPRPRPLRAVGGRGFLDLDAPSGIASLQDAAPDPAVRPPLPLFARLSGDASSRSLVIDLDYLGDITLRGDLVITARVREGVLFPATPGTAAKAIGDKFVDAVFTPVGWQPLADGTGKPLFSGTLGDTGDNVPVFNNVADGDLQGSVFCVGYTTGASTGSGLGDKYGPVFTGPEVAVDVGCPTVAALEAASSVAVQTGFWFNPAESGRGFFLKKVGDALALVGYLFEDTGRPTWFISSGTVTGDTYSGPMIPFSGGGTLATPRPAQSGASLGTLSLRFTAPTRASLTWPGGTVPLVHLRFENAGPGFPENGVWFNPAEDGTGYTIDIQGGTLGLGAYYFEDDGAPVWYLLTAPMSDARRSAGGLLRFRDGQSLFGSYRPPVSQPAGDVTLEFLERDRAVITLPNGRQLPLQKLF